MSVYVFIETLKNTKGTNYKKQLLKQGPEIMVPILLYTYDPFKNYYIKNLTTKGKGNKFIDEDTFKLLDRLNNREITGNEARFIVEKYIISLTPNDAKIFHMILNRTLDIGLGRKSINKSLGGIIPSYDVMLASKIDWNKVRYPYIASPKLDGIRATYIENKFYTRTGKEIIGVDHIIKDLSKIIVHAPLDGELLIPNIPFQVSLGKIRSNDPTPSAKFYAFDMIDTHVKFTERYEELCKFKGFSEYIEILDHHIVNSRQEIMKLFDENLNLGLEGLVLKNPNHFYKRTRSTDWMKLKNELSEDLPIIGFEEGRNKYENKLGALIVRRNNGVEVNVGTGLSDHDREEIWNNKEKYLGKTAEVFFHEETLDGSLRHPRLKIIRDDK